MLLFKLVKLYVKATAAHHVKKLNRSKAREKTYTELWSSLSEEIPRLPDCSLQDSMFPEDLRTAKKLMVVLTPEYNVVTGGILSIFSIASHLKRDKRLHGYEVVIMTLPSKHNLTYFRNKYFRSEENVYRFSQLPLCQAATDIYLHIPEYAAPSFCARLSDEERQYLASRETLHANLLNQNIQLMPNKEAIDLLRELTNNVSQSVAHHAYFSQEIADTYRLPTLLLPAYTDLSSYPGAEFSQKEKLIIYSPDNADHKQRCLDVISKNCPEFTLLEIRNITFDRYMDLATRCMFSITFGEGFDGYLAQPIYQGGIGFAVYNQEFFPAPELARYENIFQSSEQMLNNICDRIQTLSSDENRYRKLNAQLVEEYHKLYSHSDYVQQLRKLALKQFEYFPKDKVS